MRLGPTEGGQAVGTFEADERLESGSHEGRLFVDVGQSAGLFEEVIVDIERRFHTYKYGLFIHITQAARPDCSAGKPSVDGRTLTAAVFGGIVPIQKGYSLEFKPWMPGAVHGPHIDFKECVRCNVCEIRLIERTGVCRHDIETVRPRLIKLEGAAREAVDT